MKKKKPQSAIAQCRATTKKANARLKELRAMVKRGEVPDDLNAELNTLLSELCDALGKMRSKQ